MLSATFLSSLPGVIYPSLKIDMKHVQFLEYLDTSSFGIGASERTEAASESSSDGPTKRASPVANISMF